MSLSRVGLVCVVSALIAVSGSVQAAALNPDTVAKAMGAKYDAKHRTYWPSQQDRGGSFEFGSAGCKYRLYRPDISTNADGSLLVSTKVNHVRRLHKDDYAIITMRFSPEGKLIDVQADVNLAGSNKISTGVVTAVSSAGGVGTAAVAAAASTVFNKLSGELDKQTDHGGQKNLANVIQHVINTVGTSVRR